MIFFFPQNRERRAGCKALCFPPFRAPYRCFLLWFSSKSNSQMLNLSVSVAVLMLEALLIKTWSQLGLNMSASLLLRRDQEGLPPEREGDGPTAAQENVLCFGEDVAIKVLSLEGKEPLSSMSYAQRVQPCCGDPLEPHGGLSIPFLGDGSCNHIWGLELHVLGRRERAHVSDPGCGQARPAGPQAAGAVPSTWVVPSCREGPLLRAGAGQNVTKQGHPSVGA